MKTRTLLQTESTECGAVVLSMILGYYGCFVPISELRHRCGVSRHGASVKGIVHAAQSYGLLADADQMSVEQLNTLSFPAVLFWKPHHFVVLEAVDKEFFYVNDPALGRRKLTEPSFRTSFSGIVIQFKPGDDFKKRRNTDSLRNRWFSWMKGESLSVGFILLASLFLMIPALASPLLCRFFIDEYMRLHETKELAVVFFVFLMVLSIQAFFVFGQRSLMRRLECRISYRNAQQLMQRLVRLPALFFAHRTVGELNTCLKASDRLSEALLQAVWSGLTGGVHLILYLSILFYLSPSLTVITVVYLGISALCRLGWRGQHHVLVSRLKQESSRLIGMTLNHLAMMPQIKAFGNKTQFFTHWQAQLKQYLQVQQEQSMCEARVVALTGMVSLMGQTVLLGAGLWLLSQHHLSLGTWMAFYALFLTLNASLGHSISLFQQYHIMQMDARRVSDVFEQPVLPLPVQPIRLEKSSCKGKIELIDVTFGYSKEEKPLLHRVNLTIEAKSRVSIVGPSGSGKSTLANLIAGIYTPWSGDIVLDGIPLTQITHQERASLISLVSQDHFFFKGSLRDNLCLWAMDYPDQELISVLHLVCLDELTHGQGLEFQLLEGASNLSGGQRQRLELARTLLVKPVVLLLDESTSALDPLVEYQIESRLRARNHTLIHIAHRFNQIKAQDIFYTLQHGQLVESTSRMMSCDHE